MAVKPPSALERVSGNSGTAIGLAAFAAVDGGALTALLPVLGTTLASGRQKKRVESAITEIKQQLTAQGEKLQQISDEQYKLINETVLAIFHTTCDEKINYLKTAIQNSFHMENLASNDAVQLSRLVRDISADEVEFLLKNFSTQKFFLTDKLPTDPKFPKSNDSYLSTNTKDGKSATGLINLGVMVSLSETIDDIGSYKFMPITAKLIALLNKDK